MITVDLRLSGPSGRAFFERLQREHPALAARVVFITGEMGDADSEAFLEHSGRPALRKPFSVKSLISSLSTLLGPAPTRRQARGQAAPAIRGAAGTGSQWFSRRNVQRPSTRSSTESAA